MERSNLLARTEGEQSWQSDVLWGDGLTGRYRFICAANVFIVYALVLLGWVAGWHQEHNLNFLAGYKGHIPYIWSVNGLRILGLFLSGASLSALFTTLQSRGVALSLFGAVAGILMIGSVVWQVIVKAPVSDFAFFNAELIFSGTVAAVIYAIRLFRGLFILRFGVGSWIYRFFKNLVLTCVYVVIAFTFSTFGGAMVMATGGLLVAIVLLVMKPL